MEGLKPRGRPKTKNRNKTEDEDESGALNIKVSIHIILYDIIISFRKKSLMMVLKVMMISH